MPVSQTKLVLEVYRQRYNAHKDQGQVYIFNNHGIMAGESLPHPHSQITVVPNEVKLEIPVLRDSIEPQDPVTTENFVVFSPLECSWPDEVWVRPLKRGRAFGETTDEELIDLAKLLYRLIQIMDLRHGNEFPFNFYIYPGGDWYLRLIPRQKIIGAFEVGTGVFVNTQDPVETNAFLKEHFHNPDTQKIKHEHQAGYRRGV
jgi:UDPglucose--hexose-1-phosphate uridylyltransferase